MSAVGSLFEENKEMDSAVIRQYTVIVTMT